MKFGVGKVSLLSLNGFSIGLNTSNLSLNLSFNNLPSNFLCATSASLKSEPAIYIFFSNLYPPIKNYNIFFIIKEVLNYTSLVFFIFNYNIF